MRSGDLVLIFASRASLKKRIGWVNACHRNGCLHLWWDGLSGVMMRTMVSDLRHGAAMMMDPISWVALALDMTELYLN